MTPTVTPAVGSTKISELIYPSKTRTVREVPRHRHRRKQQLRTPILRRRNARHLPQQIQPPVHPAQRRRPLRRRKPRHGVVQSAARRVRADNLRDRGRDAHAAHARDEPRPDGRARAARRQREAERRRYAREEAADADGEGECGEVAELALEDLRCISSAVYRGVSSV